VEDAQKIKSKTQHLADRAAKVLTFVALGGGVITLSIWLALGFDFVYALERMVTVMVISCPHALGLAVPLVAAISTTVSVEPGRYVALTVTDTGMGMDAETQRRLFEPFFTTKELGKGTGLGLSTCYGIVKQSGGHIWVYSELGKGTVFKIYLPRVDGVVDVKDQRLPATRLDGSETVLLVEDDQRVRSALTRVLRGHGYQVLLASDGAEAMTVVETHSGTIDALLTDVVMPRSSGPEVAELIRQRRGSKVLFMSGYTEHAALHCGELLRGHSFLQKPFTPSALVAKLREILDA
jgi:CheY-like chemotaxis protein